MLPVIILVFYFAGITPTLIVNIIHIVTEKEYNMTISKKIVAPPVECKETLTWPGRV